MTYLLIILAAIIIIFSNFYIFNFQRSIEGNDERGKIVQLQMTKVMYSVLFLGTIIILIVNAVNIISSQLAINIIFSLLLLNSVSGSVFLYLKKA
ncbi:hypothetical protein [Metabacillus fastidiosus]|uniref:hypothetical protein n=1 Tax=Metabacillus fastidiosus TaxID=1458 RepID=UPI002DBC06C0|nr:hypothetical protein [Metabacillus fastidiosus]MEC2077191.1 hypothetical protein [Metabacillus fastidiosus]